MFRQLAIACAAALALASVAFAQVNQPTTGTSGGHVITPGANVAPVVTNCGSSPSPVLSPQATDGVGSITVGNASGTATSCTFTFGQAYNSPPFCLFNVATGVRTSQTASVTALGFTLAGLNGSDIVNYLCTAKPGG